MLIRLEEIKSEGTVVEAEERIQAFPVLREMAERGEFAASGPIRLRITFQRLRNLVEMAGQAAFVADLECSRCLETFRKEISADFRLVCLAEERRREETGDDVELNAEDLGVLVFDGETIHYRDALQEQLILALPYRELCRPECQGLCPHCGADLNRGGCSCDKRVSNLKFAALRDFVVSK